MQNLKNQFLQELATRYAGVADALALQVTFLKCTEDAYQPAGGIIRRGARIPVCEIRIYSQRPGDGAFALFWQRVNLVELNEIIVQRGQDHDQRIIFFVSRKVIHDPVGLQHITDSQRFLELKNIVFSADTYIILDECRGDLLTFLQKSGVFQFHPPRATGRCL